MQTDIFNKNVEEMWQTVRATAIEKGSIYADEYDRLYNIKDGAKDNNITPLQYANILQSKQNTVLKDMIKREALGVLPSEELLKEIIKDKILYLLIMYNLFLENIQTEGDIF